METVKIYTDGPCLKNPGVGAWCAIICLKDTEKVILSKSSLFTTNNKVELEAVIEALNFIPSSELFIDINIDKIEVYSDSSYVVRGRYSGKGKMCGLQRHW